MKAPISEILAALSTRDVRYLVVGGVAVVLHGHLRTTMDLDLVIQLEPDNVCRALKAFEELGFQPLVPVPMQAFADPASRESWIRDKNMIVFSVWHPARPTLKVDIFISEPFDFDTVYDRAARVDLETVEARILAIEDLIALKEEAGRPQDLADIASLRALMGAAGSTEDSDG